MDIRLASTPAQNNLPVGSNLSLTLDKPLPAIAGRQPGQPITVAVLSSQGGSSVLQLPDGQTVTAKLSPTLPAGSQLQLTLPSQTTSQTPASTPTPAQPTIHLPVKLVSLPAPSATPATTPTAPANTTAPQLTLVPSTSTGTGSILPPNTLAAGPALIQAVRGQSLPAGTATTPITASVTGTPDAQGYQPALATLTPGAPPIRLTLNTGTSLPTGTAVTLQTMPAETTSPGQPQPAMITTPLPLATQPTSQPMPEAQTLRLLTPDATSTLPTGTLPARVIGAPTPVPGNLMVRQPVLLPNGQQLLLESPQGVEGGSLLMVQLTPANLSIVNLQAPSGRPLGSAIPLPPELASGPLTSATPPADSTQPPRGTILQGTVSSQLQTNTPMSGQVLLRITTPGPWQNLEIPVTSGQSLPVGTQLTLQLSGNGQATVLNTVMPAPFTQAQALTTMGENWQALTQLVRTLPGLLPRLATTLGGHLPQLAQFVPTFLPYADAIALNNPDRTFGPDVNAFARALGLDLRADIQQLNQLQQPQQAQPGQPEPWRGILFPYQEQPGTDPHQGKFFWRRQQAEDARPESASTRFVVELSLTRFGPLQLDGLLNYPNLWMKLRLNRAPLDPGLIGSLQQLVTATLEKVGLEGGLAVEHTATFPVDPAADILAAAGHTRGTVV